jgi:hypothetical protein
LLKKEEQIAYSTTLEMMKYNLSDPEDPDREEKEDSEGESFDDDLEELPHLHKPGSSRLKHTPKIQKGTPRKERKKLGLAGSSIGPMTEDPFRSALEGIRSAQDQYFSLEQIVRDACKLVGNVSPDDLCSELGKLTEHTDVRKLQDRNSVLMLENMEYRSALARKEEDTRVANTKASEAAAAMGRISEMLSVTGDDYNKARLFEADLGKVGQPSGSKIMKVLMDYGRKMEHTLEDMRTVSKSVTISLEVGEPLEQQKEKEKESSPEPDPEAPVELLNIHK